MSEKQPTVRPTFETARSQKSAAPAIEEVTRRVRDVQSRFDTHFQKHRGDWINREHTELCKTKGNAPELKPPGAPGASLSAQAARNVDLRHARWMGKIAVAQSRMIRNIDNDRER